MPFDPVNPRQDFPELEHHILEYWKYENTFKRSILQREGASVFSFYDGPPFATGLPHYGHLLAGTIKDVIPRYQTMRGHKVQRRFGWDCHGLPVENLVEQEEGMKGKMEIEEKGVKWFNDKCRASVQRYTDEWRKTVERTGRWVDMDWDYRTMDPSYMESIWWVFKSVHDKGLIYEGHKPMHICPRCVTPLSNFEVTQGYKDVDDLATTWKFELREESGKRKEENEKTFVLAWTTTPWSSLSVMGLSVKPDATYVKVRVGEECVIFVQDRLKDVLKGIEEYDVIEEFPGSALVGKKYKHVAPWYGEIPEVAENPRSFHIFAGDYVDASEGTGIVTINGAYGEIDMEAAKKNGLPIIMDVSMTGHFTELAGPYAGMYVKDAEKKLVQDYHEKGLVWRRETYRHSYPHCWRCDWPLLNYATSSWFVAVEKIKKDLLKANAETEWVPEHIRDGRFGNWLTNARDWAISRNRYWGTPLPVWKLDCHGEAARTMTANASSLARPRDDNGIVVIGSRDALMRKVPIRFTKMTVMRHAESVGNLTPIYQGEVPGTPLTRLGRSQARAAARSLVRKGQHPSLEEEYIEPSVIYCSPLRRAQETAGIVAKKTGARVIVDDRLRELSFGSYEGGTVDFSDLAFVRARREHKWKTGQPESIYHFEGMETWVNVQERVRSFLDDTLPRHRGEHVLVVTHADPFQNFQSFFTGEDPMKISHQPYPGLAHPQTFFFDHRTGVQMDLHKDTVDEISWDSGLRTQDSGVEIFLARHGETDWNKEKKVQGRSDIPLNDTGHDQARSLGEEIKGRKIDVIITSPLKRAEETAKIVADAVGITSIEQWDDLRERDMGEYEGRQVADVLGSHPLSDDIFGVAFHYATPPGGEAFNDVLLRAEKVLEKLRSDYAGKRVLLVSHGGMSSFLLSIVRQLSHKEGVAARIPNAGYETFALGPVYRRIPEVFDCWVESGSMPYAQGHFPFEGAKHPPSPRLRRTSASPLHVPDGFPAHFIAEGLDQTRGWFYTLMVLSTALYKKPAFRHCVVNGIVLAEDGKKMSKRLKNYPEPNIVMEKYGADAMRFTLMESPAVRGENLRFSEKAVEETLRRVILPLWNTYSFFVTHANNAGWKPAGKSQNSIFKSQANSKLQTFSNKKVGGVESPHPLDQWIRAEVQDLVNRMTEQLDQFDLSATCSELYDTIDALTNWYVRLSRRRFSSNDGGDERAERGASWGGASTFAKATVDKCPALTDPFDTLYDVLVTISQLLAPFCPFITEAIYLNIASSPNGSVHLTDWPAPRALSAEEFALLEKTRFMRRIVSLGHAVRGEAVIKVRQPLQSATVGTPSGSRIILTADDIALLKQELNVKDLTVTDDPGAVAEVFVSVDARKVGPRLGGKVQEIIKAGKEGKYEMRKDSSVIILGEILSSDEAQVVYRGKEGCPVASEGGIVVCMDIVITEELKREGLARDAIRAVQALRKEKELSIADTITLEFDASAKAVLESSMEMIAKETKGEFSGAHEGMPHVTIRLDGEKVVAGITSENIHAETDTGIPLGKELW